MVKVGSPESRIDLNENSVLNCSTASVRRFVDFCDWLVSAPMKTAELSVKCWLMSALSSAKTSMNLSSWPEVGKYAV